MLNHLTKHLEKTTETSNYRMHAFFICQSLVMHVGCWGVARAGEIWVFEIYSHFNLYNSETALKLFFLIFFLYNLFTQWQY